MAVTTKGAIDPVPVAGIFPEHLSWPPEQSFITPFPSKSMSKKCASVSSPIRLNETVSPLVTTIVGFDPDVLV